MLWPRPAKARRRACRIHSTACARDNNGIVIIDGAELLIYGASRLFEE
jgi:hypothetical protein